MTNPNPEQPMTAQQFRIQWNRNRGLHDNDCTQIDLIIAAYHEAAYPEQPMTAQGHVCKFDEHDRCVGCGADKDPIVPAWEQAAVACYKKGHPLVKMECACGERVEAASRGGQIIAELEAVKKMLERCRDFFMCWRWISVNEALPKDALEVLVCNNFANSAVYLLASYSSAERNWFSDDGERCAPTHWMPLPAPPAVAPAAREEQK
jgi:Protein of unknown function (DUF551)